ncbi:hypothetical protein PILCRDRAFT_817107 [Piloderma croceum F 1598]|uniref:Phosphotyrosine protein phosphatase I domain-containing protein n=1 Tax=Piloderma croceum (strain F 1598) TaxID=765440 RepID=A0A0C3G3I5_PILCF|nr:hypothetical protein PILCRDRAFT_817107 [Piloderma croceum F 1598]
MTLSVLIVCLGNICRSPMGEAVLKDVASKRKIEISVDSCGTSAYHLRESPDPRTVSTCVKHNVPINHRARQINSSDFTKFAYILAADESNLRHLQGLERRLREQESSDANNTAEVKLWGSYLPGNRPIADPYYDSEDGFEACYEQCLKLSNAFLDEVVYQQSGVMASS